MYRSFTIIISLTPVDVDVAGCFSISLPQLFPTDGYYSSHGRSRSITDIVLWGGGGLSHGQSRNVTEDLLNKNTQTTISFIKRTVTDDYSLCHGCPQRLLTVCPVIILSIHNSVTIRDVRVKEKKTP